jgi:hypothetical protein
MHMRVPLMRVCVLWLVCYTPPCCVLRCVHILAPIHATETANLILGFITHHNV